MKLQKFKLIALLAIFIGCFSCTDDSSDCPKGAVEAINPGEKSSFFAIDNNIISFAVPYVTCALIAEHLPCPDPITPENINRCFWTITLLMPKGTDVTKLAPIITLVPGAKINMIYNNAQGFQYVGYTGIAEIGETDFSDQVEIHVTTPDGSTVSYLFVLMLNK